MILLIVLGSLLLLLRVFVPLPNAFVLAAGALILIGAAVALFRKRYVIAVIGVVILIGATIGSYVYVTNLPIESTVNETVVEEPELSIVEATSIEILSVNIIEAPNETMLQTYVRVEGPEGIYPYNASIGSCEDSGELPSAGYRNGSFVARFMVPCEANGEPFELSVGSVTASWNVSSARPI